MIQTAYATAPNHVESRAFRNDPDDGLRYIFIKGTGLDVLNQEIWWTIADTKRPAKSELPTGAYAVLEQEFHKHDFGCMFVDQTFLYLTVPDHIAWDQIPRRALSIVMASIL